MIPDLDVWQVLATTGMIYLVWWVVVMVWEAIKSDW